MPVSSTSAAPMAAASTATPTGISQWRQPDHESGSHHGPSSRGPRESSRHGSASAWLSGYNERIGSALLRPSVPALLLPSLPALLLPSLPGLNLPSLPGLNLPSLPAALRLPIPSPSRPPNGPGE
jgi:hypothetical protein